MSRVIYYNYKATRELHELPEFQLAKFAGIVIPCFRSVFENHLDLAFNPVPLIPKNFNHSFEDVCISRAMELWSIGKPIRVWWSGGIDSTCVIASLFQTKSNNDKLIVYLSKDSVDEHPNFYSLLTKMDVELQWHSNQDYCFDNTDNWNGETLNVNGGGGDELFLSLTQSAGPDVIDVDDFFKNVDDHWFRHIRNREMLDVVEKIIDETEFKPETSWELFWWIAKITDDLGSAYFSPRFLENPNVLHLEHSFFYSKDFELWTLSNPYAGHKGTWKSYKWPIKKFIYDFDKDVDYFENKIKEPSLPIILKKRDTLPVRHRIVYEDGTSIRWN